VFGGRRVDSRCPELRRDRLRRNRPLGGQRVRVLGSVKIITAASSSGVSESWGASGTARAGSRDPRQQRRPAFQASLEMLDQLGIHFDYLESESGCIARGGNAAAAPNTSSFSWPTI